MTEPLFEGYDPPPAPPEFDPTLSAGRRLTLRQAADIQAGRHPLTGGHLHPDASRTASRDDHRGLPYTCGTCIFRELRHHNDGMYPKCVHPQLGRTTRSTASDCRAWWPACGQYQPVESRRDVNRSGATPSTPTTPEEATA
jgi:hypothetical protein